MLSPLSVTHSTYLGDVRNISFEKPPVVSDLLFKPVSLVSRDTISESAQILNRAQRAAVFAPLTSPLEISGGPGVGKTKTLAERVVWNVIKGISPNNLVVLSHTPLEANIIKRHIDYGLSKVEAKYNSFKVDTFRLFCLNFLRSNGDKMGLSSDFTVLSEQDKLNFVNESLASPGVRLCLSNMGYLKKSARDIIKDLNLDLNGTSYFNRLKKNSPDLDPLYISLIIEAIKSTSLSISEWVATNTDRFPAISRVLLEYESLCKKTNSLDMNDLILYSTSIVNNHPDTVKGFQHIFVDGSENLTKVEYNLVCSLLQGKGGITISGDPNRALHPYSMAPPVRKALAAEFPDLLSSTLWTAYRSTKPISKALKHIFVSDLVIKPRSRSVLPGPYTVEFTDPVQKSEAVASFIKTHVEKFSGKAALEYRDFAVLESLGDLAYTKEAFEKIGVPYRILGDSSFWNQKEIAVVLYTLKIIQSPDQDRFITQLLKYLNLNFEPLIRWKIDSTKYPTLFAKIVAMAEDETLIKLKPVRRKSVTSFVGIVRECSKGFVSLEDTLKKIITGLELDKTPKGKKVTDKLIQLINSQEFKMDFKNDGSTNEIARFLQLQAIGQINFDRLDDNKVTLSTPYDAQGQGWPIVFSHFENKKTINQSLSQLYSTVSRSKALSVITLCPKESLKTFKHKATKKPYFLPLLNSKICPIDRVTATKINVLKVKNPIPK